MVKQLLTVFLFILPFSLLSQEIDRVKIAGKVTAPLGEDLEGVSIYNVSSQQGTLTSPTGTFELSVAENDRIAVSALQFSTFTVIVDKGVIDNRKMGIYLNPVVNQLEEVIVRPYDLLGNIIADVGRIKTANVVPQWDLSYSSLEFGYEFSDDQYSSIEGNKAEEAFFNGQQQASLNFVGLAGLLFPKKKKRTFREINNEKDFVAKSLRQRFSNSYILDVFNISEENANDFIYFAEENGMGIELLKAKNEILLLDFMYQMSKDYKNQMKAN